MKNYSKIFKKEIDSSYLFFFIRLFAGIVIKRRVILITLYLKMFFIIR